MARSLLIICYYWPPAGGPGVQRWLKFTSYLLELGYKIDLIVPDNPDYPVLDHSLTAEIPKDLNIIKVPIFEPSRLAGSLSRKRTKTLQKGILSKESSPIERFFIWLRGNLFVPDARIGWKKRVVENAQQYIDANPHATVITTGPPHSVHLSGLELRNRNSRIKWLADFRDPWTTIGYHKDLKLGRRAKNKHLALETEVLKTADAVVVTSPHTQKEFQEKTSQPVKLITNGFDLSPNSNVEQPSGDFTLSHVGTLLSERNPEVLWNVLSDLCKENQEFANDFTLNLAGNVSDEVLKSIKGFGLQTHLNNLGYLNHNQATDLMYNSQCLLLIEIDSAETKAIIPGKLFEYLASRRPIIALGPKEADIKTLIQENDAGVFHEYNEEVALKKTILKFYDHYKQGNNASNPSDHFLKYHRRQTTQSLAEEIERLWE